MSRMYPLQGGVGGGGTLDVSVETELPADVIDQTVIVIAQSYRSVTATSHEPVDPQEGDIWVKIKNDGLGAICDNGAVQMRLLEAVIFEEAKWHSIDGYYAFAGEWVQFSAYKTVTSMGYEWDYGNPSPLLTRIGDAEGLTATASVGTVDGHSDFDDMPIIGEIRRCNLWPDGTVYAYEGEEAYNPNWSGDIMVEYPCFWFRRQDDATAKKQRSEIANGPADGFAVHPWFDRGDGVIRDKAYLGAYEMGAGYTSKAGVAPLTNITRATGRTGAAAKGAGWSLQDLTARVAIAELMRIEYATHDIQAALGKGISDATNTAAVATGRTNSIAGHTGREAGTDGKTSVVWRGLENPYGNVWEWVDGFNFNNGALYFCLDQTKFADDTASNYTLLGFSVPTNLSASYASALGFDANNPCAAIPSAFTGGSETTYLADADWSGTGWRVAIASGHWSSGGYCGLSTWNWSHAASSAHASIGSRLMYIPQAA